MSHQNDPLYKKKKIMEVLPIELVEYILYHLDLGSWVRCKVVCKEWRKMLSTAKPPSTKLPWLWDSKKPSHRKHFFTDFSAYHRYRALFPPELLATLTDQKFRCRCLGSLGAWLVLMIQQDSNFCFLFNPMSAEYIPLPIVDCLERKDSDFQARLSCIPNEQNLSSNKCTVAGFTYHFIYLCKPGDNAWTRVEYSFEDYSIHDVAFHYGEEADRLQLYVVDDDGVVTAFDSEENTLVPTTRGASSNIVWEEAIDPDFLGEFKLVVNYSSQQLLVVKKEEPTVSENYRITVHKLRQGKLVAVTDLDGGMIFLGDIYCCYCPGPPPPNECFIKNSIYNVEMDDDDNGFHVLRTYTFNKSSKTFVNSTHYDLGILHSPLWFIPMIGD